MTTKILDNETKSVTLAPAEAAIGGVKASRLALSLEGGSMTITGKLDTATAAAGIAAIRESDMSLATGAISTAGTYFVDCTAYDTIIITGVGATAYAKYLY